MALIAQQNVRIFMFVFVYHVNGHETCLKFSMPYGFSSQTNKKRTLVTDRFFVNAKNMSTDN